MKKIFFTIIAVFCLIGLCQAQKLSKDEMQKYEAEVRYMITYLEETLNFIGDTTSTAQEKEIIFTESWSKIFIDDKVQIEDDLDNNRMTPINKDVQAYLKDIDFFFKKAYFQFDIQNIVNNTRDDGSTFFMVNLTRHLTAVTINNEKIDNVKNRFIEINLDRQNSNLKIASIYTSKINEKEELRNWWNALSNNWKKRLGEGIKLYDSIPIETVAMITSFDFVASYPVEDLINGTEMRDKVFKNDMAELDSKLKIVTQKQNVDISGIREIINVEPLNELSDLVSLDISGTSIEDISPLRSANKLKVLRANSTLITDISALKYDITLEELEIANTVIDDISVLQMLKGIKKLNIANTLINSLREVKNCPELTHLNASGSKISSISPIQDLEHLVSIDASNTTIRDLSALTNMTGLQSVNVSGTAVSNLQALNELENLRELYCSNTNVKDLTPLKNHRRLGKIYCDKTKIGIEEASAYTKENPYTLVIYDTEALREWWNNLPIYWKAIFSKQINLESEPNTEQLHAIINMEELDLSGNPYIQNLLPVSRLTNLQKLNVSNTEISNLMALQGMFNLQNLILKNTFVEDLSPLHDMNSLRELNIENTPITNLIPLATDENLEIVWADSTNIKRHNVAALREIQKKVTVIFQSEDLKNWWTNIDDNWKEIFRAHIPYTSAMPTELQLQQILDLRKITIDPEMQIESLAPIADLNWIESLTANNQSIRDLNPLSNKIYLKELNIPNTPVKSLEPIAMNTALELLNIENTQIEELDPLKNMLNLNTLNASGTPVSSLKPLSGLVKLEKLFINNTNVKNLTPIEDLASLKQLKVYNTKVRNKTIEKLQEKRLDLNITYY